MVGVRVKALRYMGNVLVGLLCAVLLIMFGVICFAVEKFCKWRDREKVQADKRTC